MFALPPAFEEKMKRILKEEYPAFREGYELPRKFGLRINRDKITPEEFKRLAPFELTPIPWVDNGFYYGENDRPSRHPFYYSGLYYLQEPSAMTPANILPVNPGDKVLDLCAAPGGKATELGAKLHGKGLLAANDISGPRARALLKNVEVFGIPNSLILNEVPAKLAENFPEFFDKILVDAPCSGEGMFRKDPDTAKAWKPEKPLECARMQKEIILRAADMLRPGGMLLYSTCTFSPEENEQMISFLMKERPEFEILPIPNRYEGFAPGRLELIEKEWLPAELWDEDVFDSLTEEQKASLTNCARIWPHRMGGEGHFLALLGKKGDTLELDLEEPVVKKGKKKRKEKQSDSAKKFSKELTPFFDFAKDLDVDWDFTRIEVRKGQVYYVPAESAAVRGLVFLRNGLYLGEIRKDRFEPSQALAVSLKKAQYWNAIDLPADDERILHYLKGETIEIEPEEAKSPKGWQLLCVSGYPLGWGKLVNGLLKNKFLASWRLS